MGRFLVRALAFWLAFAALPGSFLIAQTAPQSAPVGQLQKLVVTVTDENGVAVPFVRVFLQTSSQTTLQLCETDFAGRCQFTNTPAGSAQVRLEKEGFYALVLPTVDLGVAGNVEVTLSHQQEVREVVNVVESPPAIDPAQISSNEKLSGRDIIDIPYPNTRDYRNALNFIPGVVRDVTGQPHIAGAETYQTLTLLDGFNVTQPANGLLLVRLSTDAFRSVDVETSRIPAEYGKGSAGVLTLNTGIGDDHYRFSATNFTPSLQNKKGLELDSVDPRLTFSGPIRKGRMWFFDAADGEYDNVVIPELPDGSDHDHIWRVSNLAKAQTNVTSRNIVASSFVVDRFHDEHAGLSPQNTLQATPADKESVYVATVKDQHYFRGGELLETGFGFAQYNLALTPLGTLPYSISPDTAGGNYYLSARTHARRWQALSNLYLQPREWHGRHDIKFGVDFARLAYQAEFARRPIAFLSEAQTLSRYSSFSGGNNSTFHNFESSAYVEDRWLITNRLLIEPGVRIDWDEIVRDALFSPRLAGTYVLDSEGNTKLSAGIGIVYNPTNLLLVARPSAGQRLDSFFDPKTGLLISQVAITFSADTHALQSPRFLNWSAGIEKKLPATIYLKAEFVERRGTHDFVYGALNPASPGSFLLLNTRHDDYDALEISARHLFGGKYVVMVSYTRSRSHSNQALDFNVDNPILSAQAAGPYPWDTPNRFLSWGLLPLFSLPLIHKFDLAYSVEGRSGFPFNVINAEQQLVEPPGSRRFPAYFSLNLHLEKRFRFLGFYWAVRGGFNNITGHRNPLFVNNNSDSPQFLTFGGSTGRAFTTRIRFLGRK